MYHKQKKVDPRVEEDIRKAAEKCLRRIPFNLCAINKNYNQIRTTNNLNSAEKRLSKYLIHLNIFKFSNNLYYLNRKTAKIFTTIKL